MSAETDLLPEPALEWPTGIWLRNGSYVKPGNYYTSEQVRACVSSATEAARANLAELQREVEGLRLAKDAANRMLLAELSRNERLETSNERLAGALLVIAASAEETTTGEGHAECAAIARAALDQETTNG